MAASLEVFAWNERHGFDLSFPLLLPDLYHHLCALFMVSVGDVAHGDILA